MDDEWSSHEQLRLVLVNFPATLESSSHAARRSSSRVSSISFTILSSVDVLDLPGLVSLSMLTQPPRKPTRKSTAVDQAVGCAPVTQRARVRSPVGTSFLGEVYRGFSSLVRQIREALSPRSPNIIWPLYHQYGPSNFATCEIAKNLRTQENCEEHVFKSK